MEGSILLVLFLFIVGHFTKNLPTKKLFAWFITFCVKNPSTFAPKNSKTTKEKSSSNSTTMSKKDEIMTRVFATFDKNSDGFITREEMRLSLKNIGMDMEEKEIEDLIKNVDINGDGLIDINEFRMSFETLLGGKEMINNYNSKEDERECKEDETDDKERDLMKEAFDVFDEDKDGLITVEELGLVLASMGFKEVCKLEDCRKMISNVDMDEDGMVNFDEFKKMMGPGQRFMQVS